MFIHVHTQQQEVKDKLIARWDMVHRVTTRGGVEDTRLEAMAKAKDTKKSEANDSLS